jgi:hypothetical protein
MHTPPRDASSDPIETYESEQDNSYVPPSPPVSVRPASSSKSYIRLPVVDTAMIKRCNVGITRKDLLLHAQLFQTAVTFHTPAQTEAAQALFDSFVAWLFLHFDNEGRFKHYDKGKKPFGQCHHLANYPDIGDHMKPHTVRSHERLRFHSDRIGGDMPGQLDCCEFLDSHFFLYSALGQTSGVNVVVDYLQNNARIADTANQRAMYMAIVQRLNKDY